MSAPAQDAIWKALADPTRRAMLDVLREGPRTTGALCRRFRRLSRCGVMKHLGILEASGLVNVRRQGRFRWNYLNSSPLRQVYERWMSPHVGNLATSTLRSEKKNRG